MSGVGSPASASGEAVLRLLRGESLETLCRELGTTAARLSAWREAFLRGGEAALKARPADERAEENARLKAKVGELTMEGEVLREKIDRLGGRPPFSRQEVEAMSGPLHLHGQSLRPEAGVRPLGLGALHGLRATAARGGPRS